ncbi:hypothetical protein B296_00005225 [Ensete ventricosum]|uniref:Uncharacterized protein n=1 Tax=Ensete ventricosum TaxID=4639 RepID=A0A427BAH3_ENSVE|nr:hypothetical protein B296_00005225 [Ensete ventricosum]
MTRSEKKPYKITEIEQYHVISGDEGVVDGNELHIVTLECDSGDQPPDPSEPYQNPQDGISESSQPDHIPIGTIKPKLKKSRGNRPNYPLPSIVLLFAALEVTVLRLTPSDVVGQGSSLGARLRRAKGHAHRKSRITVSVTFSNLPSVHFDFCTAVWADMSFSRVRMDTWTST